MNCDFFNDDNNHNTWKKKKNYNTLPVFQMKKRTHTHTHTHTKKKPTTNKQKTKTKNPKILFTREENFLKNWNKNADFTRKTLLWSNEL